MVFVGQCEALVCLGFVEIISFLYFFPWLRSLLGLKAGCQFFKKVLFFLTTTPLSSTSHNLTYATLSCCHSYDACVTATFEETDNQTEKGRGRAGEGRKNEGGWKWKERVGRAFHTVVFVSITDSVFASWYRDKRLYSLKLFMILL